MIWMLVAALVAHAQQVPNGDFELGALTAWTDDSYVDPFTFGPDQPLDVLGLVSTPARGAFAAEFVQPPEDWYPPSDYGVYLDVFSAPFVVTHTELSYGRIDDPSGDPMDLRLVEADGYPRWDAPNLPGPVSADAFTNWVVPIDPVHCGQSARVEVAATSSLAPGLLERSWIFDDITLSGPICDLYVDGDGDGLCPRGVDTDADGDCADAAELRDDAQDCDDSDAAILGCLQLVEAPLWWDLGEPYKVVVSGANPLETVQLVASQVTGQTCPARLGGVCLGVGAPLWRVGSVVADGSGVATFDVSVPAALDDWGAEVFFQAVVDRGAASLTGPVIQTKTRPASGPAAVPGVRNGDLEEGSAGWSAVAETYYDYFVGRFACTDGVDVVSSERGLSVDLAMPYEVTHSPFCATAVRSWPVVVTHHNLGFALRDTTFQDIEIEDEVAGVLPISSFDSLIQVASDGWNEWVTDVSGSCGSVVWVQGGDTGGPGLLDDVHLSGPVCAELEDADGDGLCDVGVDLDGDGLCLSAGEHGPGALPSLPLDVAIADHEDGTLQGWISSGANVSSVVTWSLLDPALGYPAREIWGAQLTWDGSRDNDWAPPARQVVTHDSLVISVMPAGVGDYLEQEFDLTVDTALGSVFASADPAVLVWPAQWSQLTADTLSVCGSELLGVELQKSDARETDDGTGLYVAADPTLVDDLGWVGDPCPMFVDSDGDGACREGLDLDGDGACVSAGEPTPGTVQDPNEPV